MRCAAMALALGAGPAAQAQQPAGQSDDTTRRAALQAGLGFTDPGSGAALAQVKPGQPFRVEVTLRSLTGALPRELLPMAWIRPVALSDLPCTETAAAFRATGQGSAGSVDLNGLLIGILTEDDALTMLDPERNVGSANLVRAERFSERPAAMIADDADGSFILSLPRAGQVIAWSAMADPVVLASGLDRPGALAPRAQGGAWVIEEGTGDLLALRGGTPSLRLPLGARQIETAGERLAVLGAGRVRLLDADGAELIGHDAPDARAVTLLSAPPGAADRGTALLWLEPGMLALSWLDAPASVIRIALGHGHDRIAVSPGGRYAFAFGGGARLSVVDLALGRVVQVVGSASAVAEMVFLDRAAVMRTADGTLAGVMDLRMIKPGEEAVIGQFALGDGPPPGDGAALLTPLLPEDQVLVISAPRYTGFVLNAGHGTSGKPPMESIPLRGGTPRIVRALDRGLREQAPGLFTTIARLPMAARYELIVSAGIGEASFCAPVPMEVPAIPPEALPGRIQLERGAGGLRLRLADGTGQPLAHARGRLLVTSLAGNWRSRAEFTTDAEGRMIGPMQLPAPPLAIVVESDGGSFDPLVVE